MLSRRKLLQTSAAAGLALSIPHVARAGSKRIRIAHAANEVHPGHILATSFVEALDDLLPGAFKVQVFPNRQLGNDKQNLESTVAGTLEMCTVSGVLLPLVTGRAPLDAWQLPFLVRDYDHFEELALGPVAQKMLDDLRPAGLVGLATIDGGRRHFLSVKKPVETLADLTGLKTRIVPVPLHKAIWEALGTAPVGLPYGEIYGALETGVIDAVEINVSSMLGENLWEVGKNFTLTGHYPWHINSVMSESFWNTLSEEEKAAVTEAGRRSISATMAYAKKQDHDGREALKQKGVEIREIQDLDKMRAKVASVNDTWGQKHPLIAEFIAAANGNS